MDGERISYTERILNAIEYGKLPSDETERRLCALIEAEINKTDSEADMELIKACQSLMWQLHSHGETPYDSHYDANKAKIAQRLHRGERFASAAKSVGRIVATAAAVVLVVLGLKGDLQWSWLEHNDTADQQQHIISGNKIAIEMIQSAIAEHIDEGIFQTTEIADIRAEFEFIPIPEEIHGIWHFDTASALIAPDMIRLDISYISTNSGQTAMYTVGVYPNAEDAYLAFEQSEVGYVTDIQDNHVYIAQNVDETVLCWTKGLAVVKITGEIEETDGLTIIEYIIGEWLK